ncbi:hypothetical protein [Bradyrhizobium prioriisuperbiae]|uniref:hypothetical protein n=1 Tax=Bradyrhizobium prioriisuperbiae TaxID=2854389 RepID=UPI0028EBA905|nr:hypothetical protein [Bradyrhizobium prioritasuperba]
MVVEIWRGRWSGPNRRTVAVISGVERGREFQHHRALIEPEAYRLSKAMAASTTESATGISKPGSTSAVGAAGDPIEFQTVFDTESVHRRRVEPVMVK